MNEKFIEWVIYKVPRDWPGIPFVARKYEGVNPTDDVIVGPSLRAVRNLVRDRDRNLVCFTRSERDDPAIVEVWL